MSRTGRGFCPAGFTLLELLVVLAIMGLIIVAVPSIFPRTIETIRLQAAARALVADLRSLHDFAQTRNQATRLDLDLVHGKYNLSTDSKTRQLPDGAKIKVSRILGAGSDIVSGSAAIQFFPDGSTSGAQIDLSEDEQHFVVELNWLTGQAYIDE